jgi:hypothetical protein
MYNSSSTWASGWWRLALWLWACGNLDDGTWVWSLRISSGHTQALLRRGMLFLKKSMDHTLVKIICFIYFSPLHNGTLITVHN